MRILFVNRWVGLQKGGTQTHIRELAKRLADRGHSVGIITTDGNELDDLDTRVKTWYVKRNPGESRYSGSSGIGTYVYASLFLLKAFLRLASLRSHGHFFDVASVHFALEAFWMRFVRRVFGIPFVFVFEGYTDLEARQGRCANSQIALSSHVARMCSSRFLYTPKVIPLGVDYERFHVDDRESARSKARQDLSLPRDSTVVLAVGRLAVHKGIRTLLKATRQASLKHNDLITVVVGDGPDRVQLKQFAESIGVYNFRLMGNVREVDLPKYYWAADLFVLPETSEGFSGGLVLLEAMSAGLPVVASRVGGIPETVEDAAILTPPNDENSLAERMIQLIEDRGLRVSLSKKGLSIARRRDWRRLMGEYESSFHSTFSSDN